MADIAAFSDADAGRRQRRRLRQLGDHRRRERRRATRDHPASEVAGLEVPRTSTAGTRRVIEASGARRARRRRPAPLVRARRRRRGVGLGEPSGSPPRPRTRPTTSPSRRPPGTPSSTRYFDAVEELRAAATGRTYAATETVFDRMAAAVGLTDVTPEGYRRAASNESEPAPGDLAEFEAALADGSIDVLIYNTQTSGSMPGAAARRRRGRRRARRRGHGIAARRRTVPSSRGSSPSSRRSPTPSAATP